jgi:hypothetical protein
VTLKLTSSFAAAISNRIDRYLHNFKRLIEEQKPDCSDEQRAPSKEGAQITLGEATENLAHAQ